MKKTATLKYSITFIRTQSILLALVHLRNDLKGKLNAKLIYFCLNLLV